MSDLEASQTQFLYEHRETCNQIALLQLVVFLFSFIFTYSVWWSGLFGMLVALVGYFGSLAPVVQSRLLSAVVLVVIVNEWPMITFWGWAILFFGSFCFLGQMFLTWQAIQKSHSYRTELMRNPPPAELMVYTQPAAAVYTAVPQSNNDGKPM